MVCDDPDCVQMPLLKRNLGNSAKVRTKAAPQELGLLLDQTIRDAGPAVQSVRDDKPMQNPKYFSKLLQNSILGNCYSMGFIQARSSHYRPEPQSTAPRTLQSAAAPRRPEPVVIPMGFIQGIQWGYIGVMEKKMETTGIIGII